MKGLRDFAHKQIRFLETAKGKVITERQIPVRRLTPRQEDTRLKVMGLNPRAGINISLARYRVHTKTETCHVNC